MYPHRDGNQTGGKVTQALAPYRRLVELQKEMIELAQKHEHSKRARDLLRAQIAREAGLLLRRRLSFGHRLRRSFTRPPGLASVLIALKSMAPKSF